MRNSALVIVGVILIGIGALGLFSGGIPYTGSDVVIDVGPVRATAETRGNWAVPPVLAGLSMAGGVLLIIAGTRKP